ncbi:NADPH:quinone reductase-like Zn-dependent oxidoreductase [Friedmanniella endophytica]|uniref:NADPH:quinone reductase-like Zn-dependent oxidoreductase n=1 Tax=Microlunatus kandeliicorticis TaxID=1759536 RepID=A0A7W3IV24_9ACTN|nr:NADP-dependent oxidoreductase [Microlunatus kandeliicorticis]MBA8795772.1 NADPH:quinone reductase-like Zn-dependent oxidoreductase [Microlunatus kandeliicorticis]
MRAIGVRSWGGPDALEVVELPEPTTGPGQVRIRVHAAAVNPTDTLLRAGAQAARFEGRQPPWIPGMDAAGVVEEVAPDVDRFSVGDRVVALLVPASPTGGAYAEQVVLPAASVVHQPEGATQAESSTLLMNALTARLALDAVALGAGETVLVTGAAGAFGGYAVGLAQADGLRVLADAKPEDVDLVRRLGADVVLPRGEGFAAAVREVAPEGVAAVLDGALFNEQALPLVRPGGGLAVVRGWDAPAPVGVTVHPVMVGQHATKTEKLERLREQASDGTLPLRVADVLPASRAAEAHRRLEAGGVRGRLVLDLTTFD